jgi:putative endonuclease
VGAIKQRRVIFAARHYLMRLTSTPPCRFDVVVVQGDANGHQALPSLDWIRAAFDASDN